MPKGSARAGAGLGERRKGVQENDDKQSGPRSVLRVMNVLAMLADSTEGKTLAALSDQLDLPKTSLFSLLKALEAGGYIRNAAGRYLLGAEALKLGSSLRQASAFPRCARPTLEWLASETEETILLGVLAESGHEVTYVDVIESEKLLRFAVRVGNRRPLYCTAAGNVLLAFMTDAERAAYLDATPFVRFTPRTVDRAELDERIAQIRQTGVVFDIDGLIDGASGVAGAVFDESGTVRCSITIAGPTIRLRDHLDHFTGLVRTAAEELSRILNYRGPFPPGSAAVMPEAPPEPTARKRGRPKSGAARG